jgi:protein-tyrosine phosphatase
LIDLHCHILPGLDDGAASVEDSLQMSRQAELDGIAVVCATPHIRHDHAIDVAEIARRVADLQRLVSRAGIGVRLAPGGELAETEADALGESQLQLVSLGQAGAWLLLEPAPGPLGDGLEELVRRLRARGYRSIVAHPERHAGTDFEQRLRCLTALGCLIQWTAQFILDSAPDQLALRLAGEGLVHLLGSDAHSSRFGRPVRLRAAFARLSEVCSEERISWMAGEAPRAILRGEPLSAPP